MLAVHTHLVVITASCYQTNKFARISEDGEVSRHATCPPEVDNVTYVDIFLHILTILLAI